MKDTYIFDLDGTLADGRHRLHLLPNKAIAHKTTAWDRFNLAAGEDMPILDNIKLMNELYQFGKRIVILTGRSDIAKHVTEKWLWEHGCNFNELIMRPASDHRRDVEFKEEALRSYGLDSIVACFDDLEHVAKHIRGLGVTCHLVTHYDIDKYGDDISTQQHIRYPDTMKVEVDDDLFEYGVVTGYNKAISDTQELNK